MIGDVALIIARVCGLSTDLETDSRRNTVPLFANLNLSKCAQHNLIATVDANSIGPNILTDIGFKMGYWEITQNDSQRKMQYDTVVPQ